MNRVPRGPLAHDDHLRIGRMRAAAGEPRTAQQCPDRNRHERPDPIPVCASTPLTVKAHPAPRCCRYHVAFHFYPVVLIAAQRQAELRFAFRAPIAPKTPDQGSKKSTKNDKKRWPYIAVNGNQIHRFREKFPVKEISRIGKQFLKNFLSAANKPT
jgi:hypothetical protein